MPAHMDHVMIGLGVNQVQVHVPKKQEDMPLRSEPKSEPYVRPDHMIKQSLSIVVTGNKIEVQSLIALIKKFDVKHMVLGL